MELADVLGLCPAGSRAEKARVFIDATYPVYPVPVIFGKEDFIRVARRVMP